MAQRGALREEGMPLNPEPVLQSAGSGTRHRPSLFFPTSRWFAFGIVYSKIESPSENVG